MFSIYRAPAGERAGAVDRALPGVPGYELIAREGAAPSLAGYIRFSLLQSDARGRGCAGGHQPAPAGGGPDAVERAVPRIPGHLRRVLALQPGAPRRGPARGGQHPPLHAQPPGPVRAPAALRHLAGGCAPHRGGDSPSDRVCGEEWTDGCAVTIHTASHSRSAWFTLCIVEVAGPEAGALP